MLAQHALQVIVDRAAGKTSSDIAVVNGCELSVINKIWKVLSKLERLSVLTHNYYRSEYKDTHIQR
jgi:hypothetical protein